MPKITFLQPDGSQETVNAEENLSIMQAAVENEIPGIIGRCGGSMACATCHVYIAPEWLSKVTAEDNEQSDEERDILDSCYDVRDNSRLGCQIKLTDKLDGVIVALPGTKAGQ